MDGMRVVYGGRVDSVDPVSPALEVCDFRSPVSAKPPCRTGRLKAHS